MDDRTFDAKTAQDWIQTIENTRNRIRETDIYPRLANWAAQNKLQRLLDIGCGQGICSEHMALDGKLYTGVDPSPLLVQRARELYAQKNRSFLEGNAYQLPLRDASFDGAFTVLVWHLLEDLQQAARELNRVLEQTGHFLIITANPGSYQLWTDFYTSKTRVGDRFEGRMQLPNMPESVDVLYLHPLAKIVEALQTQGMHVQSQETFRATETSQGQHYLIAIEGQKIRSHLP